MAVYTVPNPDFTTNADGWTLYAAGGLVGAWSPTGGRTDPGCIRFYRAGGGTDSDDASVASSSAIPVLPGQSVSASVSGRMAQTSWGGAVQAAIVWETANGTHIGNSAGTQLRRGQAGSGWVTSSVTASAPAGAAQFRVAMWVNGTGSGTEEFFVDDFRITHNVPDVTLTSPTAQTFEIGAAVPFRVNVGSISGVTSVIYYVENTSTLDEVVVGTSTAAPWAVNSSSIATGSYNARAEVVLNNGTILDTNVVSFNVGAAPPPDTREYKASNSYTFMVMENIQGLASQIPSTALVTGIEIDVDYNLQAISRTKDIGISDPTQANPDAIFDMVEDASLEVVLLSKDSATYTEVGGGFTGSIPISRSDFNLEEQGLSEGKKWSVFKLDTPASTTIGGEEELFGSAPIPVTDFVQRALGIRFFPNFSTKPAYADSGDGAFRFFFNRVRVRLYFDAGSVEYYFASADREDVIKGTLASAYVLGGGLASGDAEGVFQLLPELEVVEGSQPWIGNDWTIHSGYPVTDDNQIGEVGEIEGEPGVGMRYNSLPTQQQVRDNRSRYQFITENFYGDPELNSMYGVHGLERAFAYNGEYFYKIYTQADPEKDSPRSVANHHGHLALGFNGGRVDISVVGEPYNFDGAMGASSWAFGDKVVGLLPLSGTILGVFGAKNIWGISGTTVDNFATQVISPNIGAIEYTICDMGTPIYANAYGIYTLSQTQQYGDYLGVPMSKDISPWLRPRLVRKYTTDREVEVAWPVRSKNQYRLAFSDGYVVSMTMNGQSVPTFSLQKYFMGKEKEIEGSVFNEGAQLDNEWWG